ncbi:hypothetical protein HDU88_004150 [Geranomyces variabilis]|nr:hypothetical protein HDU88_004150 [Geranomyces variabilis]
MLPSHSFNSPGGRWHHARTRAYGLLKKTLASRTLRLVLALVLALRLTFVLLFVQPSRFALWNGVSVQRRLPGVTGREGSRGPGPPKHYLPAKRGDPTPLCLVTTWENGQLPAYVRTSLDTFGASSHSHHHHHASSVSASSPFAEMYVFLPPSMGGGVAALEALYGGKRNSWPRNVHAVDIGSVHPVWRETGWRGFVADNMCRLYGVGLESGECQELTMAIGRKFDNGGYPLVQLRAVYGELFAPWINPTRCSAWAWADLDTLWGDLTSLLNTPLVTKHSDVFTLSFGDDERVYTRGQLTGFNQNRNARVNTVWRGCTELQDVAHATAFFDTEGWTALDEGSATNAVIQANLTLTVLPLQEAEYDIALVRYEHGVLLSCQSAKKDRGGSDSRVLPYTYARTRGAANCRTSSNGDEIIITVRHYADVTWCVARGKLWDRASWWVQVIRDAGNDNDGAASWRYPLPAPLDPRDIPPATENTPQVWVLEAAVFHMQHLKKRLSTVEHPLVGIGPEELRSGRAAVEVYYDIEGEGMEQDAVLRVVAEA